MEVAVKFLDVLDILLMVGSKTFVAVDLAVDEATEDGWRVT